MRAGHITIFVNGFVRSNEENRFTASILRRASCVSGKGIDANAAYLIYE